MLAGGPRLFFVKFMLICDVLCGIVFVLPLQIAAFLCYVTAVMGQEGFAAAVRLPHITFLVGAYS